MGVSSWEMDPYRLALWAAGQGDDGYVGPVTIHFPDGPPAPNNGYDGVAGVWAYGRVHPVLGVSPGDPALVAGIPDLVITGATVNVTPVGADLRVVFSGNVANVGTGRSSASIVGFYWSNSDGYSGGLGAMAQSIPALDAGGSRSFTAVWVEENYRTLVPATYYIQGVADDPEAVFERDEENNGSPELFVVTIR